MIYNACKLRVIYFVFCRPESVSPPLCHCIHNANSALGEMNEENLLSSPGQRLVQESGSQLNPLLALLSSLPSSFSFSTGVGGSLSAPLSSPLRALPKILLAKEGHSEKQVDCAMTTPFRPVWANQEQICHLVFGYKCSSSRAASLWSALFTRVLTEAAQCVSVCVQWGWIIYRGMIHLPALFLGLCLSARDFLIYIFNKIRPNRNRSLHSVKLLLCSNIWLKGNAICFIFLANL